MRCGQLRRFMLLALGAFAQMGAVSEAQQVQVGEHISVTIQPPKDYAGAAKSAADVVWQHELHHPGATYLAVHFVEFDLGPDDYLIVSDPDGLQTYTMSGRGKMNAGTFWARHLKGDTILLELVAVGSRRGSGFLIDEYVAGFAHVGGTRAICGTDDKENAKCYETSHPTEYDRGRAVARLLTSGSGFCTGWLVSADDHLITNEHCISSASAALNTDFDFMGEAPTCSTPNCADCFIGTVYSGGTFIQDNADLDYCLLQVDDASGSPSAAHGFLEIDNRVAVVGEEIYIVGHPDGRAKEFTIFSTHSSDTGGIARVYSTSETPCSGSGYNDVGYYADTEGGSSGSPVLARSSHKVIALHHCANCPNRGVPIHLIHSEIEAFLRPGSIGVVALDQGAYSCSDSVGIEMRDGDLGANGSANVTVTAGSDSETVVLTETGPDTAIFTGTIPTAAGSVLAEDGTLQVAHGQTATATYIDASDGQGGVNVPVVDTAVVDCQSPTISDVQTTDVQPRGATVSITADESVRGAVRYGLVCAALTGTAEGAGYANPAIVNVPGLQDNQTYFYAADAFDEAGNSTFDDNGGLCYSFTTPEIPDYFTEEFSGGLDLADQTVLLTPNGSFDYYAGCSEA
ncbi:MAG: trypsin-like peptidase domain-containing protein, partial [bacterium]|nr:trypsin-like peptidase domain-containing protein [bacterium]